MTGVLHSLLMGGGGGPNPNFTAWDANGQASVGVASSASLSWLEQGNVISSSGPTDKTIAGSPTFWSTVSSGGLAGRIWVKATLTAGVAPDSGTVGAWVVMPAAGGSVAWGQNAATTDKTSTLTIQLATDAAGTNIIMTSTGNIVRRTHV